MLCLIKIYIMTYIEIIMLFLIFINDLKLTVVSSFESDI